LNPSKAADDPSPNQCAHAENLEDENLKTLVHERAKTGVLMILIEQRDTRRLDGLHRSERLGAVFANASDLIRYIFVKTVRAVFRIG
jgi:hypothetical protein